VFAPNLVLGSVPGRCRDVASSLGPIAAGTTICTRRALWSRRRHAAACRAHGVHAGRRQAKGESRKVNPSTVVVVSCGSPVLMPGRDQVSAVAGTYFDGHRVWSRADSMR
jgi:hypothetical protein